MKKKKTRYETSQQVYLNVTDIADHLGITWRKAKRVYEVCDRIDAVELASFRVEPKKVRITTVSEVTKLPLAQLKKADGVQSNQPKVRMRKASPKY